MLIAVLAALMVTAAPQQAPQAPAPTTTLSPVTVQASANTEEPETRRICRFETVTGSNRRTRVCRDVPRQGVQDQQTREFMRENQRVRLPDS